MSKRKGVPAPAVNFVTGDCLAALTAIPNGSVRMVFSSPPYNVGKEYEKASSLDAYLAFHSRVVEQLCRVTAPDGVICWQVGNHVVRGTIRPLDLEFEPLFARFGFLLRRRFVWTFGHGLHSTKRLSGRYETIALFSRGQPVEHDTDNPLIEKEWRCGVIDAAPNVKSNHVEKVDHPCQFPVELVERFVLKYSSDGDTILDPFAGVGTTGIAANLHGRPAVCIEIEAKYVEAARARLAALGAGSLKRRMLGTAIHVPSAGDAVARRPSHFDSVENSSLLAESCFGDQVRVFERADDGAHDLLLVSAPELTSIPTAVATACRAVCVVVRAPEDEYAVYRDCLARLKMTMLNRIVCVQQDYLTVLWFVCDVRDYHFDLDAVRIAAKYPGKRSARTGEFSGNPLGKNPSDVWGHCTHSDETLCAAPTLFGLRSCFQRAIVRAFVPVGGSILVPALHERHAQSVLDLKRNFALLK